MPSVAFPARYKTPFAIPNVLTPPDDSLPGFDPNALQAQNLDTAPPDIPAPPQDTSDALDGGDKSNGSSSAFKPSSGIKKFKAPPVMPPPETAPPPNPPSVAPPPANTSPVTQASQVPPAGPVPEGMKNATEKLADLQAPEAPNENWAQRIGKAILAMTKLGPVANQIIHPKWAAEQGAYLNTRSNLEAQQKEEIGAAEAEALEAQRQASAEQKTAQAANYQATQEARAHAAQSHIQDTLIKSGAVMLNPGDTVPPGFVQMKNPANPDQTWVRKSPIVNLPNTVDILAKFPGAKPGDPITSQEFDKALDAINKENLERIKAEVKPVPAEKAKDAFQGTISKLAAAGELPPDASSSSPSLQRAISQSKSLSQQEKSDALGYLSTNATPASTTTAGVNRMLVMGQNREYPVINKANGQLEMRSAAEINSAPGNFAPAGQGATAMGKDAVFQDLHYNINTARSAISALDSMDAGTRAALAYSLRLTDPKSSVQSFLTGAIGTNLTQQQQEAVQALAILNENAMSLRSVAGMGQGSDDLRSAIQATLPSAKSPTKGYALGQLDKFEQVVRRLEAGVPGMGKAGGGGQSSKPIVQHSPSTGQYRYSLDGGQTWQPGQPPNR